MKQIINISSNGIKQAIDDLVNENELLRDKVYKQEEENKRLNNIINELEEFKEEHKIMKQILIENNLWETLLNDDRFLEHLRK